MSLKEMYPEPVHVRSGVTDERGVHGEAVEQTSPRSANSVIIDSEHELVVSIQAEANGEWAAIVSVGDQKVMQARYSREFGMRVKRIKKANYPHPKKEGGQT